MIPDSFIEELKYVSSIENTIAPYVNLTKKGRNLTGLCPFHSEKTPSFTVFTDTGSYYCFGCGNGGDVITFIRQVENLEYIDALKFLAEKNGLVFPDTTDDQTGQLRTRILEINRESAHFFHEMLLSDAGESARSYLLSRGLTPKTIRKFGVGYAPEGWDNLRSFLSAKGYSYEEQQAAAVVSQGKGGSVYDAFRDRIIFPIINLRGNVIGFGGRLMGDKGPKYLNTADTLVFKKSRNLFALNFAKASKRDGLILGEGYMDVIAMHQAGFDNSVATLGTALTSEQSRLVSQYTDNVVIAYDSDKAGQSATKRAINLFSMTNVSVSVLTLEDAKDPDEYIKKFGAQRFAGLLEGGKSAIDFEIDKLKARYDFSVSDDKVAFLGEFCQLMAGIDNAIQRDVYIGQVSGELDVSRQNIYSTVEQLRKRKYDSRERRESKELTRSIPKSLGTQGERTPRRNIKGAIAEELLITLLLLHPDYYSNVKTIITPDDFLDPGYKEIYTIVSQRIKDNLPLEMIHLSSSLSNTLMAKLTQLTLKGRELKFYPSQAEDYADAIKAQHDSIDQKQLANMSIDEYNQYLSSLRDDKK